MHRSEVFEGNRITRGFRAVQRGEDLILRFGLGSSLPGQEEVHLLSVKHCKLCVRTLGYSLQRGSLRAMGLYSEASITRLLPYQSRAR